MKMKKTQQKAGLNTEYLINKMFSKIESTLCQDPHPRLIVASHHFKEPKPIINEIDLLSLATMDLLNQFAYPSIASFCKFTILLTVLRSYGEEVTFTISPNAVKLTAEDISLIPKNMVFANIAKFIKHYAEIYDGDEIVRLTIRVHFEKDKIIGRSALSDAMRYSLLRSVYQDPVSLVEPLNATFNSKVSSSYNSHIKALSSNQMRGLKPFIVADIETLLIDNVHKPYAAGLLQVYPGTPLEDSCIDTYFSEDYSIILDSFEERSTKVLSDLIFRIDAIVKKLNNKKNLLKINNKKQKKEACIFGIQTIYFHNLSRFDGIILIKHLACHHPMYKIKPLMRNNRIYEIVIYSGKKMLFRFRDSLNLLPGTLNDLAKSLCPDLGTKGSIEYDKVDLDYLVPNKDCLLNYMKQDIILLGGVMQRAQDIYWKLFKLDIESKITLSSVALSVFRLKYYDEKSWPIHIPNKNEDTFIRKAYYGGHVEL